MTDMSEAVASRQPLITDFRDLLAALTESGVRFMVVGAHALAASGRPRDLEDVRSLGG